MSDTRTTNRPKTMALATIRAQKPAKAPVSADKERIAALEDELARARARETNLKELEEERRKYWDESKREAEPRLAYYGTVAAELRRRLDLGNVPFNTDGMTAAEIRGALFSIMYAFNAVASSIAYSLSDGRIEIAPTSTDVINRVHAERAQEASA
jgi:hypothetical protein